MASNPLWRPVEGPGRFAGTPSTPMPRVPGNALRIPQAAPNPLAAVPTPQVSAQPAAPQVPVIEPVDPISARVPVPKADFPEHEHKGLHDKTMGAAFDEPGAAHFVSRLYNLGRHLHPDIEPRHLLETTRDTWHAVRHGFMHVSYAGKTLAARARARQAQAMRERMSEEQTNVEPDQNE